MSLRDRLHQLQRSRSPRTLVLCCLATGIFIAIWQLGFALTADGLDDRFRVLFVGLHGGTDLGQLFLPLPHQWLAGSEAEPSVLLSNRLLFIAALITLYVGFWRIQRPGLGIWIVLLLGSNPFQLYEVNSAENIFSWPISIGLLVMGLHLPLLGSDPVPRRILLVPACTGAILGIASFVRADALGIALSVVLLYGIGLAVTPLRRLLAIGTLMVAFAAASFLPNAISLVRNGDASFDKRPHTLWNAVWGGLGDYDNKYGHLFDDHVIHAFGQKRYFETTGREDGDEWHPGYNAVLRDDIVQKIGRDPVWYADILQRRLWRIIGENTPPRISAGGFWIELPLPRFAVGLLVLVVFGVLAKRRDRVLLKIVCFPLPIALVALAVYSGHGASYYSVVHLFAVGIALHAASGLAGRAIARRFFGAD